MRLIDHGDSVLVRSPAKLNLTLAIRGRRDDGFHEIETVMVKVSLFDTLRFSSRTDGRISLTIRSIDDGFASQLPVDSQNLVIRAAEALRHRAGIRFGADIVLEKRIPFEAGLAGGSSNAAAALAGLNSLWRTGLSQQSLSHVASTLGSDIPFFLSSRIAAVACGRGEQINGIDVSGPLHFVIVKPPFGLATAKVYAAFAQLGRKSQTSAAPMVAALSTGNVWRISDQLCNDLELAAEQIAPQLPDVKSRLLDECRYGAMMTGSGSACFGMCGSAIEAKHAAARLRAMRIGRVFATTTV